MSVLCTYTLTGFRSADARHQKQCRHQRRRRFIHSIKTLTADFQTVRFAIPDRSCIQNRSIYLYASSKSVLNLCVFSLYTSGNSAIKLYLSFDPLIL